MKNTRTTRPLTVSLSTQLVKKSDQVMRRTGQTRSELFRQALTRYFEELEFERLTNYGERQAAQLGIRSRDVEQLTTEVRQSAG